MEIVHYNLQVRKTAPQIREKRISERSCVSDVDLGCVVKSQLHVFIDPFNRAMYSSVEK